MLNHPEDEEAVILSEEDYAAIDAVPPYDPSKRYYTSQEVLERARKRTDAWLQAAETTTLTA